MAAAAMAVRPGRALLSSGSRHAMQGGTCHPARPRSSVTAAPVCVRCSSQSTSLLHGGSGGGGDCGMCATGWGILNDLSVFGPFSEGRRAQKQSGIVGGSEFFSGFGRSRPGAIDDILISGLEFRAQDRRICAAASRNSYGKVAPNREEKPADYRIRKDFGDSINSDKNEPRSGIERERKSFSPNRHEGFRRSWDQPTDGPNRDSGESFRATRRIKETEPTALHKHQDSSARAASYAKAKPISHLLSANHIKEVEWTKADMTAVNRAINDSSQLAPKVSAVPSKEKGDNVLVGRTEEELGQLAVELGEQKYRGKQLHQFIYKNKGTDYAELQLLPQKFRDLLKERGFEVGRIPVHHVAAAADGTTKLLLRLEDDRLVEAVGIPTEAERGVHKLTACVSSQVGCPLRCSFCATGKGGFARNLRPHEIVSQVLALEEVFRHRVSNVVFMGMGEPLLNLPSVLAAHRCLNKDLGIGQRMMTISTVGVPNTIQRLAQHKLQSTLAISLHAPNQRLRELLVPSAKAYPLEALLADCKQYFETTGRRVSFEYTLLAAVNDQPEHAEELAALLRRWDLTRHVNVIPYNPVMDSDYRRPNKAHVMAFAEALKKAKVTVTIRQTRGLDANAACGQLRNEFQKTPMTVAST